MKLGWGERFKSAGMFPDVGKIQGEMNMKFDQLVAELREMKAILAEIRDQGRPA